MQAIRFTVVALNPANGNEQYVVVAAGGHGKLGTTFGDSLVAFALP